MLRFAPPSLDPLLHPPRHPAHDARRPSPDDDAAALPVVGKRSLTEELAYPAAPGAAPVPGRVSAAAMLASEPVAQPVQLRAEQPVIDPEAVRRAALRGTRGAAGPLPFLDRIQRAFGRHDVARIQAHTGAQAADASRAIGARAFATGDQVAFAGAPDLHTAAHEAAHVVQQRAGVALAGGVGAAGDRHEVHADRVADLVVAGQSAEPLLDDYAGGAPATQRAVQCAPGAGRDGTGRPDPGAPYVDAPPGGGPTSVGITVGDVIHVRVTAKDDGALTARVTTGGQYVQIGATAGALGAECAIGAGVLHVKGLASNETQARAACEITIYEGGVELQKLQPKVYSALDLPIHAWKVTISGEEGDDAGIELFGEEMDMDRVIADVAATWRAAGINVTLAATETIHLQVDDDPDISRQVKQGLQRDERFQMTERQVHLVFVPIYERLGLTFSRYSRDEHHPDQMTKDDSRQAGYDAPMAIIGVNGFKNPQGAWGSRSAETEPIDGQQRDTTQADKDFHYQSLSSDTAHELGHILSLPHVHTNRAATLVGNADASYAFNQLMHSQVATPLRLLTGENDEARRQSARNSLTNSAHPSSQVGEMRTSTDRSYSTQRGALITDPSARFARDHLRTGRVFSQGVEDEIRDQAELDQVRRAQREARGQDDLLVRLLHDPPEVVRDRPYRDGARDLVRAAREILEDAGAEQHLAAVVQILAQTHASVELLTTALARVLDGRERVAQELAAYIAEHSGEDD
jgi:hypothetical protein